jgi:short subunit dehydrogenase-like uncharacterized protein
MTQARPYEVVAFGAAGCISALTAPYLARHGRAGSACASSAMAAPLLKCLQAAGIVFKILSPA